jgi:hypothetical protein
METTQDKTMLKRRLFFIKLFSGIGGGWAAGNLISSIVRSITRKKTKGKIQVAINPLAVPRTKNEMNSHGA